MTERENPSRSSLQTHVHRALKQYHGDSFAESPLAHLNLYRQAQRNGATTPRQATNQVLHDALQQLSVNHAQDAELIEMRFLDLQPISVLANKFNMAESTVYAQQRQAVNRLADVVQEMEITACAQKEARLEQRLESTTNDKLFGVDASIERLLSQLVSADPPWLVSIEGIGGIGKTTLADALMRKVVHDGTYDEIGWVSARQHRFNLGGAISFVEEPVLTDDQLVEKLYQQLLPNTPLASGDAIAQMLQSLRRRLKESPHLIVVDNLETLLDVESLLPTLRTLINPSKFILTSRKSLFAEPSIFHFAVPELERQDALLLVRHEAQTSNLPELASCQDDELQPIYETVGGNPLALRLVVGQNHIHPLGAILNDLKEARGETVDNLYTFIYHKAWDSLDELSQRVFLGMVLMPPGGDDVTYLSDVVQLGVDELRVALNKLVTLNLVDARGGLHERRYSIHGLTRTFLQEQVGRW